MQSIEQFYPFLNQPFKAVITAHQKPDGDAMGSSLASEVDDVHYTLEVPILYKPV